MRLCLLFFVFAIALLPQKVSAQDHPDDVLRAYPPKETKAVLLGKTAPLRDLPEAQPLPEEKGWTKRNHFFPNTLHYLENAQPLAGDPLVKNAPPRTGWQWRCIGSTPKLRGYNRPGCDTT